MGSASGARQRRGVAEQGAAQSAAPREARFAVTTVEDLHALDAAGNPLSAGAAGLPAGALLARADAETRLAALQAGGGRYQIIPEVQVAQ